MSETNTINHTIHLLENIKVKLSNSEENTYLVLEIDKALEDLKAAKTNKHSKLQWEKTLSHVLKILGIFNTFFD